MEEVWIVHESLCVEGVVIKDNGSIVLETTTNASHDEPHDPGVCKPASHSETLDRQLTDDTKTDENAELSARCVVSPVEIRLVSGASDHGKITSGEPALQNIKIVHGFGSPLELTLLESVL